MTNAVIDCPTCGRKLRPPAGHRGQAVRCPKCQAIFTVETFEALLPEAEVEPPPFPLLPGHELSLALDEEYPTVRDVPPPPRPLQAIPVEPSAARTERDLRVCSYCGDPVRPYLAHCPSCGQALHGNEGPFPFRRDWEPHRAGTILALGVVSLCLAPTCVLSPVSLPMGILACTMAFKDLGKMKANLMDPAGESSTQTGRVCGVLGMVLSTLWLLFCGLSFMA